MTVWTFGPFTLDARAGLFTRDGVDLKPQPLVVKLLVHAAERPGELLKREELIPMLWPDVTVTDHSLSQLVHRIRKHLGPHRAWWATVPRRGYRFDAPLQQGNQPVEVPASGDSFHGRAPELSWLETHATAGAWVLLVGQGGVGKTRLARELVRERPGHLWLDLADVTSAMGVVERMATRLGIPHDVDESHETVLRVLRHRRPETVVLDNLEQLSAECTAVFDAWRAASTTTTWVGTSRRRDGVRDPVVLDVTELDRDAAREVFRARAAFVGAEITDDDEAALSDVLDALVGLPLALELAAARTSLLDLPSISARLESMLAVLAGGRGPERHHSVEAAVRWSWDLLDARERDVLVHLGLFPAGATVAAVERTMALGGRDDSVVLDVLQHLQRSSLVQRRERLSEGWRLGLHPVVRAFVLSALHERADQSAIEQAVAATMAERMQAGLSLRNQWSHDVRAVVVADLPNATEALERVPDADGLRAATALCAQICGQLRLARQCVDHTSTTFLGILSRAYLADSSSFDPLLDVLEPTVQQLMDEEQAAFASDLMRVVARRALHLGHTDIGEDLAERALDLARQSGDPIRVAWAHVPTAGARMRQMRFEDSLAACDAGLSVVTLEDHPRLSSALLDVRGRVLAMMRNPREAIETLMRANAAAEAGGLPMRQGSIEQNLAAAHAQLGDLDRTIELEDRARARFQQHGMRMGEAVALNNLGLFETYRGNLEVAGAHFDAARGIGAGPYVEQLQATTVPLLLLHRHRYEEALAAVDASMEKSPSGNEVRAVFLLMRLLAQHGLGRPDALQTASELEAVPTHDSRGGVSEAIALVLAHVRGEPYPELQPGDVLAKSFRRMLSGS